MFDFTEEKDSDFWRARAASLGRCEWQLLGNLQRSQAHTAHAVWTPGTFLPAGYAASGRSFISLSSVTPVGAVTGTSHGSSGRKCMSLAISMTTTYLRAGSLGLSSGLIPEGTRGKKH